MLILCICEYWSANKYFHVHTQVCGTMCKKWEQLCGGPCENKNTCETGSAFL